MVDYLNRIVVEAEQHIWLIADHPFRHHHSIFNPHPEKLTSFRGILQRDISQEELEYVLSFSKFGYEQRFLEKVQIGVAMNEKIACVVFPDLKGRLDMSRGFVGTTPRFLTWCHDLYRYYWERARAH